MNIRDGRANGFWLPIIRRLALRRMPEALTVLADVEGDERPMKARLDYRRAWRLGSPVAAYNRAIDAFNRGQLASYRHWLRRAADAGDAEAKDEVRRFETRLPHADARRIGRHRPYRRSELR
ncbi:hypothetical protein [Sphingomonas floccifaciens]|uniref:hypothetical protein n=1 Tax=Sphingomonas floccifaciens TaxID=1844115 RepID=UPI0036D35F63